MDDKKYLIWLSSLPGIGSIRISKLLNYFESARHVFECSEKELQQAGVLSQNIIKTVLENRSIEKIEKYIKNVQEKGIQIISLKEEAYPINLKNIYDPPAILYVKGTILPQDHGAVAMVGSRKATQYGIQTAQKLASEFAKAGVTVVSGMALGIDTYAHKGALEGKGRTLAVLGCGLNHIYPTSNLQLSEEIIKNGALLSEYPLGMPAIPGNFPARNRIISGMSRGVIIVEAAKKSGSLITTDFALEQGRDVFAVPGAINAINSQGTNELIRNGATLITCVEDVLNELGYEGQKIMVKEKAFDGLTDIQRTILNAISHEPSDLDRLIQEIEISSKEILANLSLLEIKGFIFSANNKYYKEI